MLELEAAKQKSGEQEILWHDYRRKEERKEEDEANDGILEEVETRMKSCSCEVS